MIYSASKYERFLMTIFFSLSFGAVELMTMNVEQPLEQSHNNLIGQRFQQPHLFGLNECFVPNFF